MRTRASRQLRARSRFTYRRRYVTSYTFASVEPELHFAGFERVEKPKAQRRR